MRNVTLARALTRCDPGHFFKAVSVMKRSLWNVLVLANMLGLASSFGWAQVRVVDADQVQIGRYSTQAAEPPAELADPLAIYAQLSYPRQAVESVGAALNYTLMRTGYRLVATPPAGIPAAHGSLSGPHHPCHPARAGLGASHRSCDQTGVVLSGQ